MDAAVVSDSNGSVNYTVKELLARMDTKLDAIDGKLESKADAAIVAALTVRVDNLDRGEFPEATRRALDEFIDRKLNAADEVGWTRRERWMALAGAVIILGQFLLSLYLAAHGAAA